MPEPARRRWTTGAAVWRVLAVAVGVGLVVAYSLAGVGGLLLAVSAIAVVGALVALSRAPAAPALPARMPPAVSVVNAPYRTFRRVTEQLSWAAVSPRHYDGATRPLLQRLMASRLAERHGVDVHRSPDAARALVGADLWPWLDPARPASTSSRPPGLAPRDLERVVERLEAL